MAKRFFYNSVDFNNRGFSEIYNRVSRWVKIDYTPSGSPFFRHNNRRYHLDNFIRLGSFCSAPMEPITAADGETVTLNGYEIDSYYKTLFIEISDGGEAVRVYRYEGTQWEEETA